ncbi:MAG: hypothetical protein GF383_01000 [Candidatus Lokiarchaeota archaeon]|nr:hypothetical protein [Candidatus Lokiarchaeota archaeon]MBD3337791.1 hypothetical protein [Candidatus Lokiarchaeota archaeon]
MILFDDLLTILFLLLIVAIIVAVINFVVGVVVMIKMASLRGMTKKKEPAIIINAIWSIILLLTSFSPWTYAIAFLINFIIGLFALQYDNLYGLKEFRKRIKILFVVLTVQFLITFVVYMIALLVIFVYVLGII